MKAHRGDLRTDAGLHLLHSFSDEVRLDKRVEFLALARTHGHMPRRPLGLRPFVHVLVASIAEGKKERMFAFGASCSLSKRTSLYGDAASKRFPDVGAKTIYGVGLTHSF